MAKSRWSLFSQKKNADTAGTLSISVPLSRRYGYFSYRHVCAMHHKYIVNLYAMEKHLYFL